MIAIMLAGVALTLFQPLALILCGIVAVTFGFFGAHSIASSWVGSRAIHAKAQASALYLFCYYVGSSAMGTLGGEAALRQRRTLLGGAPTLPTFPVGAFSGDNLAFVQSTYAIPLPQRLALPIIGPPSLRFTHVAGAAWTTGGPMPLWEQNLGAGLAFSFASAELFIDPAGDLEPTLRLGLELPSF